LRAGWTVLGWEWVKGVSVCGNNETREDKDDDGPMLYKIEQNVEGHCGLCVKCVLKTEGSHDDHDGQDSLVEGAREDRKEFV
jgi:hypothetical protein